VGNEVDNEGLHNIQQRVEFLVDEYFGDIGKRYLYRDLDRDATGKSPSYPFNGRESFARYASFQYGIFGLGYQPGH
jgi:hypothetical protein